MVRLAIMFGAIGVLEHLSVICWSCPYFRHRQTEEHFDSALPTPFLHHAPLLPLSRFRYPVLYLLYFIR